MIIPVRCFSCGIVIAHKWEEFKQSVADGKSESDAMDDVGLKRYCCRRMMLGTSILSKRSPRSVQHATERFTGPVG